MIKAVIFDMYETLITQYKNPVYFSEQIASDLEIVIDDFREIWRGTDYDRSVGRKTLFEVLSDISEKYGKDSKEAVQAAVAKRIETKKENFRHINKELIPLMERLREKGLKLGLISNCYSEEAPLIRNSVFFRYFDAVCLSYEEGIIKPDREIYRRCLERLSLKAEECIYIGDGGSSELASAGEIGMTALQAGWYLKDSGQISFMRDEAFPLLDKPNDVLGYI